MRRYPRSSARKATDLAKLLVALDVLAADARPRPRRLNRIRLAGSR
jgi:hypothetical protein